jgi:hypothetical protein
MSELHLPPIQPYSPTTFLERGVAVPFTTPRLYGSRIRPTPRGSVELILPNPSGSHGVYVLAWDSLPVFCRPTVHDRQLIARMATLTAVTPGSIRRVARAIAAEGMAGEEAMEAALANIDASKDELVVTNYLLLMALVDQVDAAEATGAPDASMQDVERRAQKTIARIAPRIGRSPDWIATSLEALAEVLCDIGIGAQSATTRVRRTLDLLRDVRAEIGAWSRLNDDAAWAGYAEMICTVAEMTLSLATTRFQQAQALTADPIKLLRTWATDPDAVIQIAGRPEWLLDGWDQICLLWRQAVHPAAQRAAVAEIAQLVPVLPREARGGDSTPPELESLPILRGDVPLNQDWRTGEVVLDLIARNEHLRAAGV